MRDFVHKNPKAGKLCTDLDRPGSPTMTPLPASPYETNLDEQVPALERAVAVALDPRLQALDFSAYERIVLTGMGSSDSAATAFEFSLIRSGLPVWRLSCSRLLDTPELLAGRTLLWITSQSGRSGEAVALAAQVRGRQDVTVVALTNDPDSPLAQAAQHVVLLHSGVEATVSCKSYLNSLAWFHRLGARFRGSSDASAIADIRATAAELPHMAAPALMERMDTLAQTILAGPHPRLALVGTGIDSATALAGALILKEASKVHAEGYVGGAFRHGPIELAGPGLTAVLFGEGSSSDVTMTQLSSDLLRAGSTVVTITPKHYPGTQHLAIPSRSEFDRLALGMAAIQRLSVALARRGGYVPGQFLFGAKVTSQL